MERIEDRAFSGCTALEHVIYPATLQYIGHQAFSGAQSVNKVEYEGDGYWLARKNFEKDYDDNSSIRFVSPKQLKDKDTK